MKIVRQPFISVLLALLNNRAMLIAIIITYLVRTGKIAYCKKLLGISE